MSQVPTMEARTSNTNDAPSSPSESAPSYCVPSQSVVSVEHPFIIKNLSKAMEKLGKPKDVANLVDPGEPDPKACLFLRPEDRMSRPIWSGNVKTGNVIVRVSLPKRTGRRRLRGSRNDFHFPLGASDKQEDPIASIDSRNTARLVQGLSDNVGKYAIEPVGLPDFAWSTSESPFAKRVREHLLPSTLEGVKSFKFDMSKGPKVNEDLLPPPSLSSMTVPFNYSYKQNPATKLTLDEQGQFDTINTQAPPRLQTIIVPYDIGTVPDKPSTDMTPYERLDDKLRGLVDLVKALFDEQPIWTRRAVKNRIHQEHFVLIGKYAYQYVGYMFSSGPWRDSVVKYGIDPRTDVKYRIYQTLVFKMKLTNSSPKKAQWVGQQKHNPAARGGARNAINMPEERSHIFDGTVVSKEGRTWQVCDVVDPPLQKVLATSNLRSSCEIYGDGWYHNGTWSLVKAVMRVKIDRLVEGKGVLPESDYAPLMAMPEMIDSTNKHLTVLSFPRNPTGTDRFQMELLALFRTSLNPPESEPRNSEQVTEGVIDDGMEDAEEDDDDDLVNPRLQDIRREVDRMEKSGELGGDVGQGLTADVDEDEDEDEEEDDMGPLLKEGKMNDDEDEDSDSAELDDEDGDEGLGDENEDGKGNEDEDWENADEDEIIGEA